MFHYINGQFYLFRPKFNSNEYYHFLAAAFDRITEQDINAAGSLSRCPLADPKNYQIARDAVLTQQKPVTFDYNWTMDVASWELVTFNQPVQTSQGEMCGAIVQVTFYFDLYVDDEVSLIKYLSSDEVLKLKPFVEDWLDKTPNQKKPRMSKWKKQSR